MITDITICPRVACILFLSVATVRIAKTANKTYDAAQSAKDEIKEDKSAPTSIIKVRISPKIFVVTAATEIKNAGDIAISIS